MYLLSFSVKVSGAFPELYSSIGGFIVDRSIDSSLGDGTTFVIKIHGELPDCFCDMEVMPALYDL